MKRRHSFCLRLAARWAPLLASGTAIQLSLGGCDPEVKDALLTGIQTSITGLIDSLFGAVIMALQNLL